MDPRVGRFASIDPHSGALNRPVTLHDYAYAGLNPINRVDPTGKFTMTDLMGGFNTAMNVISNLSFLSDVLGSEDEDSEKPGLWDSVLATMVGGANGLIGNLDGNDVATLALLASSGGKTARHHVVPLYLCGADREANIVPIDQATHLKIHGLLDGVTRAVNLAGQVIQFSFRRGGPKQKLLNRPVSVRFARTPAGRGVFLGALTSFYTQNGYLGLPAPRPQNIASVLATYGPLYVANRGSTSWPVCKR